MTWTLKFLIVSLLLLHLISCKQKEEKSTSKISMDTLRNGILYYTNDSIEKSDELFLQNMGRLLRLHDLFKTKSDTSVRIWSWKNPNTFVVDITYKNDTGRCDVVKFKFEEANSKQYIRIQNHWNNIQPKSGWPRLTENLRSGKIISLRGGWPYEELDQVLTTMSHLQFEIATLHNYRFYEYIEPSFYRYVDTGSMNVYIFLKYLNIEIGIQMYCPPDKLFVQPK